MAVPSPSRLLRLATIAACILGGWCVAGLFFATQHHLIAVALGEPDDLVERLVAMYLMVSVTALITPIVFALADRFPLRRPRLGRNALITLAIAVAVAVVRAPFDLFLSWFVDGERVPIDAQFRLDWIAQAHTYLLFSLVLMGVANYARLQREAAQRRLDAAHSRTALAHARLRRLQADLKPHFLFNSLNAVAALVHADPPAAERTLDTLSDLLRRSMECDEDMEIPLAEELRFVQQYLDIQRTRFGHRLRTSLRVAAPELLSAAIPPFLIQPLVENAIMHGVSRRRDGGSVEVHVGREGGSLKVEVRDNGPGCEPSEATGGGSVGVPHAMARLRYLYGSEQTLSFRREEDAFVVDLRLPFRPIVDTRENEYAAAG